MIISISCKNTLIYIKHTFTNIDYKKVIKSTQYIVAIKKLSTPYKKTKIRNKQCTSSNYKLIFKHIKTAINKYLRR